MAEKRKLTGEYKKYGKDPLHEGVYFEIMSNICSLDTNEYGMTKELNIVSWNGGEPKFDIRCWSPAHDRMTRGMTLTGEEVGKMVAALTYRYTQIDLTEGGEE